VDEARTAPTTGTVAIFVVLSLLAGGVLGYFTPRSAAPSPITVSTPAPTPTRTPTCTPGPIRVYVSGAVRQPAVVELPPGSIVEDAIAEAGGASADADLDCINLARQVEDQQQVYLPYLGEGNPPPPISGGNASVPDGAEGAPIDINTATTSELETLPRIGPTMAQRIVEYREANGPFQSIEDIQDVPGIGPATYEAIRLSVKVTP
jgi:competence protein ComEA